MDKTLIMPSQRTANLRGVAVLLLCGLASCVSQDSGPPLVVQRDSAGIEIVEALRPLWGDSSLWSIDPDPLVDLALSGSGPAHEFYRAGSMKQRPDGSLVIADRDSREVRVFSETGEFRGFFGGRGDGPGEFRNLGRIENAADTLLALGAGRVTVVTSDLAVIRTFNLSRNTLELHYLGGGMILPELNSPVLPQDGASGLIRRAEPLALFDLEGTQIDSIGETRGADTYAYVSGETRAGAAPLFAGRSHIATLGQRIFRGSSDRMQVDELDMSGNLLRILRIPGYPLDLSDARIAAERDARLDELPPALPPYFREMIEAMPAPETRPAYSEMLVARGGLAGAVPGNERTGTATGMAGAGRRRDLARHRRDSGPLRGVGNHHGDRARGMAGRNGRRASAGAAIEAILKPPWTRK